MPIGFPDATAEYINMRFMVENEAYPQRASLKSFETWKAVKNILITLQDMILFDSCISYMSDEPECTINLTVLLYKSQVAFSGKDNYISLEYGRKRNGANWS